MTTLRRLTRPVAALLAAVAAFFVWGASAGPAHAADEVNDVAVDATLKGDGAMDVTETLTFDAAPGELTQRIALAQAGPAGKDYRYDVTAVRATADGKDLAPAVKTDDGAVEVTVRPAGAKQVVISYTVRGATHALADGSTSLEWRYLQGLSLPVQTVRVTVNPPASFSDIECKAGDPAAPQVCRAFSGGTHQSPVPTFSDGPIGANGVLDATVRFPRGVAVTERTSERWSLDRAFSVATAPLVSALATALLGAFALWAAFRRGGRDLASVRPTPVAELRPTTDGGSELHLLTDVRPGQVGTLLDERVDPVDVTATVLDLAVRGHLRIEELPRASAHAPLDWTFTRLSGDADELRGYERELLDAIAPADGREVTVSQIGPAVTSVIPTVQSRLYDEMVERRWYARRPDATRGGWSTLGWAALLLSLVALALLVAFTHFGLLGLALVAIAVGLLLVSQEMPRRTEAGSSVLAGLADLRQQLATAPVAATGARGYATLSRLLPYATVLGGQERWLAGLVAADDDAVADPQDLAWYHAPATWHLRDLPASLDAFITTMTGRLFRRD